MKKLIQKYYKDSFKKNSNSVQFKQIQNIINKKEGEKKHLIILIILIQFLLSITLILN